MGSKNVYLPLHVPARLVTVPGSARIKIEMEGIEPLGYDPPDGRLFVFGDLTRRPVDPPLTEFQTRALLRLLARHTLDRMTARPAEAPRGTAASGPAAARAPEPGTGDAEARAGQAPGRPRPVDNVVDIRSRQHEARATEGSTHSAESGSDGAGSSSP